jgi:SanA protein
MKERIQTIFSFGKKTLKGKWSKRLFLSVGIVVLFTFMCDRWIISNTKKQVFNDIKLLPDNKVGLVLGTVKGASDGRRNLFFDYRIKAAVELFRAGKIKHIIVSGDNHVAGYDEPSDMRDALMAEGIPSSCITLDYAGFRTFDSVPRCKKVFGQSKFTIISQKFHNERALFIANKSEGIDAVAYNAQEVSFSFHPKTFIREYFARVKCVLDVYLLNTKPKFLGKPEVLPV